MSTTATQSQGLATPPTQAILALRDIRRTYFKPDGSVLVEALRGVSLSIPRGQFVAIMGSSGSGKSTMMNVLGCLDRPTKGNYFVDGEDVSQMSDEQVSQFRGRKIGFVFQSFNLIPQLTIQENAEVPLFYQGVSPRERRARSAAKLNLVGLGERMDHRPNQLSGGQQQRAAIARALITDPVVLMADEPTGNLDSATGRAVLRVFADLHKHGMTIVMVTHDPTVAALCERVIWLKDGLLEADALQEPQSVGEVDHEKLD